MDPSEGKSKEEKNLEKKEISLPFLPSPSSVDSAEE